MRLRFFFLTLSLALSVACARVSLSEKSPQAADDLFFSTYIATQADRLYVAGRTGAADFPTTPGSYDRLYAAEDDGFVTAMRLPPVP